QDAAAEFQQVAKRDTHRQLEVTRLLHVPGNGKLRSAPRTFGAETGKPGRAVTDDCRHAGEALGVVDGRRASIQAEVRRERRLESRHAYFAFQRLEQSGFLAADVSAGADKRIDVDVDAR